MPDAPPSTVEKLFFLSVFQAFLRLFEVFTCYFLHQEKIRPLIERGKDQAWYRKSFEDWANARWRAGHKGHEKLGTDLLLEKLNYHIHRENKDRPIDEYQITTDPELDEAEDGPGERALRNDEDIGSLENSIEELGFQHLREDGGTGKWMSEEIRPEEAPKEEALD